MEKTTAPLTAEEQAAVLRFLDRADVYDILTWICFQTISVVRQLRLDGHEIPTKAEHEQAYFMRWALRLAASTPDWRVAATEELKAGQLRREAQAAAAGESVPHA